MLVSDEDLRREFRNKTDEELYNILHTRSDDYTLYALGMAKEEFQRRNLESAASKESLAAGEAKRTHEAAKRIAVRESRHARLGGLVLVVILGFGSYSGYEELDSVGWVSHSHDSPVWIQGDWIVGEYRDCGMRTTTALANVPLSAQARAELPRLFCGKNWEAQGIVEFETATHDPAAAADTVFQGASWEQFAGMFHTLPVRFYGRVERPDSAFISWRCQRLDLGFLNSAALECKALN